MAKKEKKEEKYAFFIAMVKADLGLTLVTEHRFHPKRLWRFDFCLPDYMIAIEIEGGVWTQGRHTRGAGAIKDMEKYNEAVLYGWRLLRFVPGQISSNQIGYALDTIKRAINFKQ